MQAEQQNHALEQLSSEENATKRPYQKPELKVVALRPEEAVLGNCKANDNMCNPMMVPTVQIGS